MSAAEVWVVDLALSRVALDRCTAVLDPEEGARAARFLRQADRDRYAASHAALRLILGRALGLDPRALAFTAGPGGKPELAGAMRGRLAFNLSHSGARALVGLARGAEIGVDVEAVRPLPDALRIARAHFAPDEAAALAALPPAAREAAFFGLWTRKEAVAKALGSGLSLPLDRFSVTLPPAPPRLLRIADGNGWTLAEVASGPGTAATAAVWAAGAMVRTERLPAGWTDALPGPERACGAGTAQL